MHLGADKCTRRKNDYGSQIVVQKTPQNQGKFFFRVQRLVLVTLKTKLCCFWRKTLSPTDTWECSCITHSSANTIKESTSCIGPNTCSISCFDLSHYQVLQLELYRVSRMFLLEFSLRFATANILYGMHMVCYQSILPGYGCSTADIKAYLPNRNKITL